MKTKIKAGDRVFLVQVRQRRTCTVTTKRATFLFTVKGGVADPVIAAEPVGREPASARPLSNDELFCFALNPGIPLEGAQRVADFLNEDILQLAITRFGDSNDAVAGAKPE